MCAKICGKQCVTSRLEQRYDIVVSLIMRNTRPSFFKNLRKKFHDLKSNLTSVEATNALKMGDHIPEVWMSDVTMSAWIETGMHQLFQGIVASIMIAMDDLLTSEKRATSFYLLVNPYLIEIQCLRLD